MNRPGFSFLVCPDSELIKRRIASLVAEFGAQRRVYWADEELPPAFWQDMGSQGLFGGCKAIVLRRAHKLRADTLKQLKPLLGGFNEAAWPIFCIENDWTRNQPSVPAIIKKQPFWGVAEKNRWVWLSPGLNDKTLPDHLRSWAKDKGFHLPREIGLKMCDALPHDAAAVDNELAKIELAMGGRTEIGPEELELLSSSEGIDYWALLDALAQGRVSPAIWREVLRPRSSSDGLLFPLLAGLTREARQMWLLLHGEPASVPKWKVGEKQEMARRIGKRRLSGLWRLAMEAELGVKSGEKREDQALEQLVAGLCALFGALESKARAEA